MKVNKLTVKIKKNVLEDLKDYHSVTKEEIKEFFQDNLKDLVNEVNLLEIENDNN